MRNIMIIFCATVIITTSCKGQIPIANIKSNKISSRSQSYSIENEGKKYIVVKNLANRLENVTQVTSNLDPTFDRVDRDALDIRPVTKICAHVIGADRLRKMPQGMNDALGIAMRFDVKGSPKEMVFVISTTSLISANDLAEIEQKIKASDIKITFLKGAERYLKGANFFSVYYPVPYRDMLKVLGKN